HSGARCPVPCLLPGLPGDLRRSPTDAGQAVAGGGNPPGARQRPGRARRRRAREDVAGVPHTLKDVLPVTATVNRAAHLEIGGCDTCDLAAEFGTPLYVFDEATFRTRARELRTAFPDASLYFAAKACPALAVLQLAAAEGLGVDVASTGELHAALVAGVPPA